MRRTNPSAPATPGRHGDPLTHGRRASARSALLIGALLTPCAAWAESGDPMLLHERDGLAIRAHAQFGLNAVAEQNLFWNFADTFASSVDFNPDTRWLEAYVKPGLTVTKALDQGHELYGGLSMVASSTFGTDAFDVGDTGRVTLEEGYIGLRAARDDGRAAFDVSVGPREFKAGTGMLLANGGSSGFSRGALKLGPHKAWAFAGLARLSVGDLTATALYLDPNESPDNDSGTRIAGLDLRYDRGADAFLGATLGKVVASSAPYPKAAPNGIGIPSILPGARDGLWFFNAYGRVRPLTGRLENAFVAGDLALERNDDIDLRAWAARMQVGYVFANHRWSPILTYAYQTFSGDDPSTSKLERFDPLYYEGSPSAWSTGSKSSMVFINSNVHAHQVSLRVSPSPRDTVTLRYARISANELLSPIQFGQATRVVVADGVLNPIAGVTSPHLSDDLFIEYTRALTPRIYLTAGFSVSLPGPGVDSMIDADAPYWTGGFLNVVANF